MKTRFFIATAVAGISLGPIWAWPVEVQIPIDTNQSTLQVELCVGAIPPERCDQETHPVGGSVVVDLDNGQSPTSVSLRDFDVRAMADYVLEINYGLLLGRITVTARNLRVYHAQPGPANPYVPLVSGSFEFHDVPYRASGTADYVISGLACTIIGGTFPCASNIDLATLGENTATNLPGTLLVSNGVAFLTMDLQFSTPLDPEDPTLGRLSGRAVVRGAAPLPTPNQAPTVALVAPSQGAALAAGRPLRLEAQAIDPDGTVTLVEFFSGTNRLAAVTGPGPNYELLWTNPPSGWLTLTARATDNQGASAVSAPVQVTVGVYAIVPTGSVWKYLDDGSDQGTAWRARTFDDTGWASGPAPLGYGDPDLATVVSYGPDPNNKYITTYFRRSWYVADRSLITGLLLRLMRDDGAVVYLNGVEVFRSNITNSPVTYSNLASATVGGADETNFVVSAINHAFLLQGTNTLAVEVHQASPTSSDLRFDLELLAARRFSGPPALWIVPAPDGGCVIGWPSWAVGYQLESASSLAGPSSWLPVTQSPHDDGTWKTLYLPATGSSRFFRLRAD
jgi:hypothetical protein